MEKAMKTELENNRHVGNAMGSVKEIRDTAMQAKDKVEQSGNRLVSEARDFIQNDAPEYLREGLAFAQKNAKQAIKTSEQAMRRNVWYSVLGAAGLGLVAGALIFRRRH